MIDEVPKILFLACCGPCATILADVHEVAVYTYFNGDNFDTEDEYFRRLDSMELVDPEVTVAEYNPETFATCEDCIRYRLQKCAWFAKVYEFDAFSTTLTVSPYKDTAMINRIGYEVSLEFGIPYIAFDFKRCAGFAKTVARSKRLGLYRQKYCGCARSRNETGIKPDNIIKTRPSQLNPNSPLGGE